MRRENHRFRRYTESLVGKPFAHSAEVLAHTRRGFFYELSTDGMTFRPSNYQSWEIHAPCWLTSGRIKTHQSLDFVCERKVFIKSKLREGNRALGRPNKQLPKMGFIFSGIFSLAGTQLAIEILSYQQVIHNAEKLTAIGLPAITAPTYCARRACAT
jgi:hypothetical protein